MAAEKNAANFISNAKLRNLHCRWYMSKPTEFRERMQNNTSKKYDVDHRAALFGQQYASKKEQDPELVC